MRAALSLAMRHGSHQARFCALALALPLAACMGPGGLLGRSSPPAIFTGSPSSAPLTTQSLSLTPVTSGTPGIASPAIGEAVMLLPEEAGLVKEVKERHFRNGTRQEVFLDGGKSGAGDNVLEVSVQTAQPRSGNLGDLQLYRPSEQGIRSEIIGRFRDVRMSLVTQPTANNFGPVGIAIGRHPGGASCIFAWQWIEDVRNATSSGGGGSGFASLGASLSGRTNHASIRVRLCSKTQSADQLVAHVQSLRMGDRIALDRIIQMDRSRIANAGTSQSIAAGRDGTPGLIPVGGSLESLLPGGQRRQARASSGDTVEVSPAPRRATPRPRARPRDDDERVDERAQEREWQRRSSAIETPRETRRTVRQETQFFETSQGRYLAPVQGMQSAPGGTGGGVAPATAQPPRQQLMNLPAEAYRGPSSQSR
jgi:Cellulose biosynthesis protein BcsN